MTELNLMQQFKFTPDDLQANRRGQLSAAQQSRWIEADQWAGSLIRIVISLVTAVLIVVIGIVIGLVIDLLVVCGLLSLVMAGVVGGALWLWSGRKRHQAAPHLVTAVGRAEGIAHLKETLDSSEHSSSRRYKLEIGHHTFQLFRKEQFEALEGGVCYAVYYLDDNDKHIVSLERV